MASERSPRDGEGDRGSIPLDIDDVQLLLQVEQVQIQKRTFTNWVNAQLVKVMSGQRMSRERDQTNRGSSMESLASLDTRSSLSSFSSRSSLSSLDPSPRSSPLPGRRASPLHNRFKLSAKKALLLWVREQCHKAGCTLNVKDFKSSWRSGVVFLAVLCSLRPDLVDLAKAQSRSNLQNLEEAFRSAERELRIPRLLEPCDLQYLTPPKTPSPINLPVHYTPAVSASPLRRATPNQKAQEVTCWLLQAHEELLEGWNSTEGESYAERYNWLSLPLEQRRPVMPLLTAMKRSETLSEEQRALREAWDALAEKLREYKVQLDLGLPAPLAQVGRWLLRTEAALMEEEADPLDPGRSAQRAHQAQELLNACLEEMPQQMRNFQTFQNVDESGNLLVPTDKLEELKRRFTSVRVTAKYHGIKLEYQEQRHTVLELLARIRTKLRTWKRPYVSQESVSVLLQEWHELVNRQQLPTLLETALHQLRHVSGKYSSKSALSADYGDTLSSLMAWLEQGSFARQPQVGEFLMEVSDPQTTRNLADDLRKVDEAAGPPRPPDLQVLIRDAMLILQEPLETMSGPLRTYRKRIQFMMKKMREVDLETEDIQQLSAEQRQKLTQAVPEVIHTLLEAEQVCVALQQSVCGVDGRLAELLHWEVEARELYQILKAGERRPQRAQDPRARVFISRGLQLEGQVVTEEQDLQVMVMTSQKNSPVQYVHASAMQNRVRAAVAQSQEVVGLLSSLGARRDRSQSPPEDQPSPPKRSEDEPVVKRARVLSEAPSSTKQMAPEPRVLQQQHQVPTIVVQEYRDKGKMSSPPLPYSYAQAFIQRYRSRRTWVLGPRSSQRPGHSPSGSRLSRSSLLAKKSFKAGRLRALMQAQAPPQGYPQSRPPQQQWAPRQDQQIQAYPQQRQSLPQAFQQNMNQPTPPPQVPPQQWAPIQPQLGPQQGSPGYPPYIAHRNKFSTFSKSLGFSLNYLPNSSLISSLNLPSNLGIYQCNLSAKFRLTRNLNPQAIHLTSSRRLMLYPFIGLNLCTNICGSANWTTLVPGPSPEAQPTGPTQAQAHHTVPQTAKAEPLPQPKVLCPQPTILSLPQALGDSLELRIKPQALVQATSQAYTEAYSKAQALARNGFEDAKHCLQQHILEVINVFKDKPTSGDRVVSKEETLRTLDPEMLEGFLRAAEGMEAFCTPSQLQDMELFTQSVRTQWEAVRAEISGFVQQVQIEVTREAFNTAALRCETLLASRLAADAQECFSAEGSAAQAGEHLEGLMELCDTLSPEDSHRLAQAQLWECENRLAAIQRQFSGEADPPPPPPPQQPSETGTLPKPGQDMVPQRESGSIRPACPMEPSPVAPASKAMGKMSGVERKETEKQSSVEEDLARKDLSERYESSKKTLLAQMAKNEQILAEGSGDSVSLKGLHTRLQEIQCLRQETESLWSDFSTQCSTRAGAEREKAAVQDKWRAQLLELQSRGGSLGTALRQIDSTENHMVDFTDRLDRYLRQPKDVSAFSLGPSTLSDIKELDDSIQSELDQLSRLDSVASSPLQASLSREVASHRASLDQLRQQVRKSEAAARALDHFLMSLRAVERDIGEARSAPCGDPAALQEQRAGLALSRQSVGSLRDKAPQLDVLLQGARLVVTRDGAPASCLDMVVTLLGGLERANRETSGQQRDAETRSLGLRRRSLLGRMRTLMEAVERQELKEPTMPAVQLRALSDLDVQLKTQHSELQTLTDLHGGEGAEELLQPLKAQWEETKSAVTDRLEECTALMDLLKRFQACRSHISGAVQRAEQVIGEQASYLSKDNLQRLIAKVRDMKQDLSGVGVRMEEIRGVCRQLQTHLKKLPSCGSAPLEAEAESDALMDNWLDVTEKSDSYVDNLQVALELWEKQLQLGMEVEGWAGSRLALFAESHAFHSQQQVLDIRDEIQEQEENIERFHKKTEEIHQMLQGQEPPLELQVIETQLRKRMEQVKELFSESTDVFEELVAVKKHLAEKIQECAAAVENIQTSVNQVSTSEPRANTLLQDLSEDLDFQEDKAQGVVKELGLISSVASPQALDPLPQDASRLHDSISLTRELIQRRRGDQGKDLVTAIRGLFAGFLEAGESERRLAQLRERLVGGGEQVPPLVLEELTSWLEEQQKEVSVFTSHCSNRRQQMQGVLDTFNSLQEQYDVFQKWLQNKEKDSVVSDQVSGLLKDLQDQRGRAESLADLVASVRRQGVRADSLLKDGDNLLQRYRNLETRLQDQQVKDQRVQDQRVQDQRAKEQQAQEEQARARRALEGQQEDFHTRADSTQTWIRDLAQAVASPHIQGQHQDIKRAAQAVLDSKPEGDTKIEDLRRQGQTVCEHEGLEESRRTKLQQTVEDTEEEWRKVLEKAEESLHRAKAQAAVEENLKDFKNQKESVLSWVRQQNQNLRSLGGHMTLEERLQIPQNILASKPAGDAKIQDIRGQAQTLCENEDLEETGSRREVQQLLRDVESQWEGVLHGAEEAERSALSEDFHRQKDTTLAWVAERRRTLEATGSHTPAKQRVDVAQNVLGSRPEGDCQAVTETEEQWRLVLQSAKQILEDADAQVALETEKRDQELREFDTKNQEAAKWIGALQQKLTTLAEQTNFKDRLHTAQAILSAKHEVDAKMAALQGGLQALCDNEDLEESRRLEVRQTLQKSQEQWRSVLEAAKRAAEEGERRCALEELLRDVRTQRESTATWLEDKRRSLLSVDPPGDPETLMQTAQAVLGSKPEGDGKVDDLRRRGQSACERDDLEESRRTEVQEAVEEAREQWRKVLEKAEEVLRGAELQYSLSRELEAFQGQAVSAGSWVEELQDQAVALETLVTRGSQEDIESRLNTAQTILGSKSKGESFLSDLSRRAQSLCQREDLEESSRQEVQKTVTQTEERWRPVLRRAEEAQRALKAVTERRVSCEFQRCQAQGRLAELQRQTSALPRLFPWPGLGDRRQAAEEAGALLDRTQALGPGLQALHKRAEELFETTQDPTWIDPSWASMEGCLPGLLSELTEAGTNLEQGILTERQFTQLVEQHGAAQDWLRDHVKALGPPPAHRQDLQNTANTLKALLQTVDREEREMRELDTLRDRLLILCTPGGRDSLALEVRQLHDLRVASEREVRAHLVVCEGRLGEMDRETGRRNQGLRERGAALQWELRSLDQALSYSEPQNHVVQLQQHWASLQKCEGSLEGLGVKVEELYKEVKSVAATEEMPAEAITMVESLKQQNHSLRSRLKEHQDSCTMHTSGCLSDCLRELQQWNLTIPTADVPTSVQVALEEGEKLQLSLREVLSHQQFLVACLKAGEADRLERESSETLQAAVSRSAVLAQTLKGLEDKKMHELQAPRPSEVHPGNAEVVETSLQKVRQTQKKTTVSQEHVELRVPSVVSEKSETTHSETETSVSGVKVITDTTPGDAANINVPSDEPAAKAQSEPTLTTEDPGRVLPQDHNEPDQLQRTEPESKGTSTLLSESAVTSSSAEPAVVREELHAPDLVSTQRQKPALEQAKPSPPTRKSTYTKTTKTSEPNKTDTISKEVTTDHTKQDPASLTSVINPESVIGPPITAVMAEIQLKPTGTKDIQECSTTSEQTSRLAGSAEIMEPYSVKKLGVGVLEIPAVQTVDTYPQTSCSETVDSAGMIGIDITPEQASKKSEFELPQSQINVPLSLLSEVQQPEVQKPEPIDETTALKVQVSVTAPVAVKTELVQIKPEREKSPITPDSIPGLAEMVVVEQAMVVPARKKQKSAGSPMMRANDKPSQSKQDSESVLSSVAATEQGLPGPSRQSSKLDRTAKQPSKTTITTTKAKMEKTKKDSSVLEPSKSQDSTPGGIAQVDLSGHLLPRRRKSRETPEDSEASKPASDVAVPSDVQPEPIQAESETSAVEQTKLVPTMRKSKTSMSSVKRDADPEQKARSKPGVEIVALKPSPPTRRSKSTKTSEPIKTETIHKEVITVQTKEDPSILTSLIHPDSVLRPSTATVGEDTTLEPTDTKYILECSTTSEQTSCLPGPADVKTKLFQTQPENEKSITPDLCTGPEKTGVIVDEVKLIAARKTEPDVSPMTHADVKPVQSTANSESVQPFPIGEEQASLSNSQSTTVHEIVETYSVKKVGLVVLDILAVQTVDTCPQTSSPRRADSAASIGLDIQLGQAELSVLPQLPQSHINVPLSLLSEEHQPDVPKPETTDQTVVCSVTAPAAVKIKQVQTKPVSEKSPFTPDSIPGLVERGVVEEAMGVPAKTKPAGSPIIIGKPAQSKKASAAPLSYVAVVGQALPVNSKQSPKADRKTANQPAKTTSTTTKVKTENKKQDLSIVEPSNSQDSTPLGTAKVDEGLLHLVPSRRRSRETPDDSIASEPGVVVFADVTTKLAESETTADDQTKLVTIRKKSKTSVPSVKIDTEPEQKMARSKPAMKTVALEQAKPSPPSRRSKSTKTTETIKTDAIHKEVTSHPTKEEPASLKSLTDPESVTRQPTTAVVEVITLEPSGTKENQKDSTTTELAESGVVVEEAIVAPARRRLNGGSPMTHADGKPSQLPQEAETPQPSPLREEQAALSNAQSITVNQTVEPFSVKKVAVVVLDIPAVLKVGTYPQILSPESADSAGSIGVGITLGHESKESEPQSQIYVPQSLLPEEQQPNVPKPEPTDETKALQAQESVTAPVALKTEQVPTKPESERSPITQDSISGLSEMNVVVEAMVISATTKSIPAPVKSGNPKPAQSKQDSEGPLSSIANVKQALPGPSRQRQSPKVDRTAKQPAKTSITKTKVKTEQTKQDSSVVEPSKRQYSTPVGTAKVDVGDSDLVSSRIRSSETTEDSTASGLGPDVAVPTDVTTKLSESGTTANEQTTLVPTRRKSKTSVSSVKLEGEPEQKMARSKPAMEKVTFEQAKPSPPSRRSKSTKTSQPIKTHTSHKEVITIRTEPDHANLKSLFKSGTRPSTTAIVEETKIESTGKDDLDISTTSEATLPVTGPAYVETEQFQTKPGSVMSIITSESITGLSEAGIVKEAIVAPAMRNLKPDESPLTHAGVIPAQSTEDPDSSQPSPLKEEQAALSYSQSTIIHEILEPYSVKKVAVVVLDIPAVQTVDTCPQTSSSETADCDGSVAVDITLGQASKESEPSVPPQLPESQINVSQSLPEEQQPDVPKPEPTDQTQFLQAQASVTAPAAKVKQVHTKPESKKSPYTPDTISGPEVGVVVKAKLEPARTKSKPSGSPVIHANTKPAQSKQDSEGPGPSVASAEQALPVPSKKKQIPKVDRTTAKQPVIPTSTTATMKAEKTKQDLSSMKPSKSQDSIPVRATTRKSLSYSQSTIVHEILEPYSVKKVAVVILDIPAVQTVDTCPKTSSSETADRDESITDDITLGQASKESEPSVLPQVPQSQINVPQSLCEEKQPDVPTPKPTEQTKAVQAHASVNAPAAMKTEQVQPKPESEKSPDTPDSISGLAEVDVVVEAMVVPARTKFKPAGSSLMRANAKPSQSKEDSEGPRPSVADAEQALSVPSRKKLIAKVERTTAKQPVKPTSITAKVKTEIIKRDLISVKPSKSQDPTPVRSAKVELGVSHIVPGRRSSKESPEDSIASESASDVAVPTDAQTEHIQQESETTADEQSKLLPTMRKSLTSVSSMKIDVEPEPPMTAVVEETKVEPTGNKHKLDFYTTSDSTTHVTGLVKTESESVTSPSAPDLITGLAETGVVVEEAIVVPARRRVKPDSYPMTHADVKPAQSTEDSDSPQPSPIREEQAALSNSQSTISHEILEPYSIKKVAVVVLDIPAVQTVDTCPQTSSSETADCDGSITVDITLGQASKESKPSVLPKLPLSPIDVPQSLLPEGQHHGVPKPEPTGPMKALQVRASVTAPADVKIEQCQIKPKTSKTTVSVKLATEPEQKTGLKPGIQTVMPLSPTRMSKSTKTSEPIKTDTIPKEVIIVHTKQDPAILTSLINSESVIRSYIAAVVEEIQLEPIGTKENVEVYSGPTSVTGSIDVKTEQTKPEIAKSLITPVSITGLPETGVVEEAIVVPGRRKVKTGESPLTHADVKPFQSTEDSESHHPSSSLEQASKLEQSVLPQCLRSQIKVPQSQQPEEHQQDVPKPEPTDQTTALQAKANFTAPAAVKTKQIQTECESKKSFIIPGSITGLLEIGVKEALVTPASTKPTTGGSPRMSANIKPAQSKIDSESPLSSVAAVEQTLPVPSMKVPKVDRTTAEQPLQTTITTKGNTEKTKHDLSSVKPSKSQDSTPTKGNEGDLYLVSSRRKSKETPEDSTASESASDVAVPAVQTKHIQAESETIALEHTKLVPTKRKSNMSLMKLDHTELEMESSKSCMEPVALEQAKRTSKGVLPAKTSVSSMKLADAELEPNKETESPESPQSPLSEMKTDTMESKCPMASRVSGLQKSGNKTTDVKNVTVKGKATVLEEPLIVPIRKKSTTTSADVQTKSDTTVKKTKLIPPTRRTSKTLTKEADTEPESTKDSERVQCLLSSKSDMKSDTVAKPSPAVRKSKSPKLARSLAPLKSANKTTDVIAVEPKEVSDLMSLEFCISRESVTMETITAVVEEAQLVPTRRKSQTALSSVQSADVKQQQQKDSECLLSPQSPRPDIKTATMEKCPKLAKISGPETTYISVVKPEQTQKEPSSLDYSMKLHKSIPRSAKTAGGVEARPVPTRKEPLTSEPEMAEEEPETLKSSKPLDPSLSDVVKETQAILTGRKSPDDSTAAVACDTTTDDTDDTEPESTKDSERVQSLLSSKSDMKSDTVAKPSPAVGKSKSPKLARSLAPLKSANKTTDVIAVEPKEVSDLMSLEYCISRESVTMETITAVVEEAQLVPTRRKSQTALSSVQSADVKQQQQQDSECLLSPRSPRPDIKTATMEKCPKLAKTSGPGTTYLSVVKPEQTQKEPSSLDSSMKLHKSIPRSAKTAGGVEARPVPTRKKPLTSETEMAEEEPETPKSSKPLDPSLSGVVKETQAILTRRKSPEDSTAAVAHDITTDDTDDTEPESTKDSEHVQSLLSSKSDMKSDTVAKPSPAVRKSKSPKLARSLAPLKSANKTTDVIAVEPKEVSDLMSLECCISRESVTMETRTAVVEEAQLVPTRRKSQTALSSVQSADVKQQQQQDSECLLSPRSPRPDIKTATMEKCPQIAKTSGPRSAKTAGGVEARSVPTRKEPLTSEPEMTEEEPETLKSSKTFDESLSGVVKETQAILTGRKSPEDSTAAVAHDTTTDDTTTDVNVESGASTYKDPVWHQSSAAGIIGHLKPGEMIDLKRPAELTIDLEEATKGKGTTDQLVVSSPACDYRYGPIVQLRVGSTKECETIVQVEINPMSEESCIQSNIEIQVVDPVASPSYPASVVSLIITDSVTGPSITAVVEETQVVPTGTRESLEVSPTCEPKPYVTGLPDVKTSKPERVKCSMTSGLAETHADVKSESPQPSPIKEEQTALSYSKSITVHENVRPLSDNKLALVVLDISTFQPAETCPQTLSPKRSDTSAAIKVDITVGLASKESEPSVLHQTCPESPVKQQSKINVTQTLLSKVQVQPDVSKPEQTDQTTALQAQESISAPKVQTKSESGKSSIPPDSITEVAEACVLVPHTSNTADQTPQKDTSECDSAQTTLTRNAVSEAIREEQAEKDLNQKVAVPVAKQTTDSEVETMAAEAGMHVEQPILYTGAGEQKIISESQSKKQTTDSEVEKNKNQVVKQREKRVEVTTKPMTDDFKRADEDIKHKEDGKQEILLSVATATTLDHAQVAGTIQMQ
ncbi:hypothetical protein NHX12_019398, partial [Muraenolepis orangiensis]